MPEDVGIFGLLRFRLDRFGFTGWNRLDLVDGVIADRIGFGRGKTLAFGRHHMQELRTFKFADVLQGFNQQGQVVAIDRADVVEPQFLEQRARGNHALEVFLGLLGQRHQVWRSLQNLLAAIADLIVGATGQQFGKVVGQPANVPGNRHVIVVEDHQHVGVQVTGVVQCLERHAGGHGAVTNNGNALSAGLLQACCDRHAQRCADGSAGMADAKGVVVAFGPFREAGQTAFAADASHGLFPSGQDLVGVGLMADVPHQAVARRIKDVVKGDGKLKHAQAGPEMTASLAH